MNWTKSSGLDQHLKLTPYPNIGDSASHEVICEEIRQFCCLMHMHLWLPSLVRPVLKFFLHNGVDCALSQKSMDHIHNII